MKTKLILFLSAVLLSAGALQAQANQECATTASLAYSDAKAKNYDAAYPRIQTLRKDCPTYSVVTYQYGERVLKHMLEKAPEGEKKAIAQDLIKLYEERLQHFPGKTKAGEVYGDIAQVMYDYKLGTPEEQYAAFDKAYQEDKDALNAKSLYTYFSLLVDLQDAGKRDLQDVFSQYDVVIAKVEEEENKMAEGLAKLIEKQEAGEQLTAKEEKMLNAYEINLKAYSTVRGSINAKLGQRADCDNLVPLYSKDFEANKSNVEWLKRAAGRLSGKDCTEDPLFFKLVEALHQAEPSAKSALYLGQLADAEGNASKALEYYNQSAELEKNPKDKARVYYRIADEYKRKGQFGQARNYYRKTLQALPSYGRAYLQIANMIAQSANNCGNTAFEKRAVYWLAADYAARAGRVDPSISSTANETAAAYRGRAPQRSDIFQQDMQGKTINIGCWIGESVRVPNL
ncbi:Tetratricopeptide repeat-containing protein [Salinimicrobium catena]|uniref:Tetratricopeptide repeat-containing protein n=1 Tax=Salinimicrobium catena TaxID=390640 RepID=A0A1H5JZH9_9FLAO|nr:tetratricopeptide repeat protein [Salinimicrobium catena]SDK91456.1 Tetratricopeptide repeat-containing protein [Salinimicrobium catena]SEE57178.1 Tetratricopeptide repeat-containing protein [Salinimicrobium catena]